MNVLRNLDEAGNVGSPSCESGTCNTANRCASIGVSGGACNAGSGGSPIGLLLILASLLAAALARRRRITN